MKSFSHINHVHAYMNSKIRYYHKSLLVHADAKVFSGTFSVIGYMKKTQGQRLTKRLVFRCFQGNARLSPAGDVQFVIVNRNTVLKGGSFLSENF